MMMILLLMTLKSYYSDDIEIILLLIILNIINLHTIIIILPKHTEVYNSINPYNYLPLRFKVFMVFR